MLDYLRGQLAKAQWKLARVMETAASGNKVDARYVKRCEIEVGLWQGRCAEALMGD